MSLVTESSFRWLADRFLRQQLKRLEQHLVGIEVSEDIEDVHQARVASRRLRVGLNIMGEHLPETGKWRRQLKRLTRGLGPARDLDIQIAFLGRQEVLLHDPNCRPGIARLLLRLQQERASLQTGVLAAVRRIRQRDILYQMHNLIARLCADSPQPGQQRLDEAVLAYARQRLTSRLGELLAHADSLSQPDAVREQHALRIAAKRLRYEMEAFAPVYAGKLGRFIRTAKKIQSLLGEVHDCDVWVACLERFLEEEYSRTVQYFGHGRPCKRIRPGIVTLSQERVENRHVLFSRTQKYWTRYGGEALGQALEQVLVDAQEAARSSPSPETSVETSAQNTAPSGDTTPAAEQEEQACRYRG